MLASVIFQYWGTRIIKIPFLSYLVLKWVIISRLPFILFILYRAHWLNSNEISKVIIVTYDVMRAFVVVSLWEWKFFQMPVTVSPSSVSCHVFLASSTWLPPFIVSRRQTEGKLAFYFDTDRNKYFTLWKVLIKLAKLYSIH